MKKKIISYLLIIGYIVSSVFLTSAPTFANVGVAVSPMNERIVLTPGETFEGSFIVSNSATNNEELRFGAEVIPFYVDDNYNIYYDKDDNGLNQIVQWITIDNSYGKIGPNQSVTLKYTIDVPVDAPAGGQYAAIRVGSINDDDISEGGVGLKVTYGIAHIIYAEVLGNTNRSGEIVDISVPSFLFSGNISGKSMIKNTGNVHGIASYTLQVYPLFSSEEVYTNEEAPKQELILPDRALYNETAWYETPSIGIFNVVYTVEFEGTTAQVKKLVIKCPIWLLFIIIFAIIALIMYFFVRSKNRKNNKKRTQSAKAE